VAGKSARANSTSHPVKGWLCYDVANYAQIGGFAVNLIVLWLGFEMRFGL
jgi:hypothetical protein